MLAPARGELGRDDVSLKGPRSEICVLPRLNEARDCSCLPSPPLFKVFCCECESTAAMNGVGIAGETLREEPGGDLLET